MSAPELTPSRFVVFRHSTRFDQVPESRFKVAATWEDRGTRPHDPPIVDFDLPATKMADVTARLGLNVKHVWSSPFRRCLETAGAVAKVASAPVVQVHNGLGEACCYLRSSLGSELEVVDTVGGTGSYYLPHSAQKACVGDGIDLLPSPVSHEGDFTWPQASERFLRALYHVMQSTPEGEDAVLVTHGFAIESLYMFVKNAARFSFRDYLPMDPRAQLINQILGELRSYQDGRAVMFCSSQVLARYNSLVPAKEEFVFEDGRCMFLLAFSGTVPTVVRGVTYHTPITMYLLPDFPRSAPMCFCRPTSTMIVERGHPHVTPDGKVTIPSLSAWTPSSNLLDVLGQLSAVFSVAPPLKAIGHGGHPPAPAPAPTPAPAPAPASWYPPAVVQDPKVELTRRVTSRLTTKLQALFREVGAELAADQQQQARLETRGKSLHAISHTLEEQEGSRTKYAADLATYHSELVDWLALNEGKVIDDADALAVPTDVMSQQLLDAVSESNACDEAMYYIRKLLDRDRITLEEYLKEVRIIARRQFTAKQLTFKVANLLGRAV